MSIEEVGKLTPGPKAFQVYVLKDRGLSREFLQRAREAGFGALQLTVDVPGVNLPTSSILIEEKLDSEYIVPASWAARATAVSP